MSLLASPVYRTACWVHVCAWRRYINGLHKLLYRVVYHAQTWDMIISGDSISPDSKHQDWISEYTSKGLILIEQNQRPMESIWELIRNIHPYKDDYDVKSDYCLTSWYRPLWPVCNKSMTQLFRSPTPGRRKSSRRQISTCSCRLLRHRRFIHLLTPRPIWLCTKWNEK